VTPVKQSKLYARDGIHNGNCYAACLASLLDLPLWMVPPFEDMFGRGDWRIRTSEWLKRMFRLEMVRSEGHPADKLPTFYIANGRAARGVHHSVIYSGDRAGGQHDAHAPRRAGSLVEERLGDPDDGRCDARRGFAAAFRRVGVTPGVLVGVGGGGENEHGTDSPHHSPRIVRLSTFVRGVSRKS
jgi:hypothetical protein